MKPSILQQILWLIAPKFLTACVFCVATQVFAQQAHGNSVQYTITIGGPKATEANKLSDDEQSKFITGEIVFDSCWLCDTKLGFQRDDLHGLYEEKRWNELVFKIVQIKSDEDILYYYLGYAAEMLGHYKAAESYYKRGLSSKNNCGAGLNVCKGIDLPGEFSLRIQEVERKLLTSAQDAELAIPTQQLVAASGDETPQERGQQRASGLAAPSFFSHPPRLSTSSLKECGGLLFVIVNECIWSGKFNDAGVEVSRDSEVRYSHKGEYRKGVADGLGKGTWYRSDGKISQTFEGHFKNGVPAGDGEIRDGDSRLIFEGKVFGKELNKHGRGRVYFPEDDAEKRWYVTGNFKNGELTSGELVYQDGDTYFGEFNDRFEPFGSGTLQTKRDGGQQITGVFIGKVLQPGVGTRKELEARDFPYYAKIRCSMANPTDGAFPSPNGPVDCFIGANGRLGHLLMTNGDAYQSYEKWPHSLVEIPNVVMLRERFGINARMRQDHQGMVFWILRIDIHSTRDDSLIASHTAIRNGQLMISPKLRNFGMSTN